MKKIVYILVLMVMSWIVTGCNEIDSEVQVENQPVIVEYKDIDKETVQLLKDYMDKINLILELGWNDTNVGEVRFETDEFKKVLEILYEYKTGQLFPQKNNIADIQSYIDISSQYFNFDTGYLRRVFSSYMYDFATDSVYTAGDMDTPAILNIKDICQKDGIYEITYSRKYETYNEDRDSYTYTSISKGVLSVKLDSNGDCKFISNKLETSEYKEITNSIMRYYIRPRLYAMTDMLNYSWNEENKGSLYVDTNAQVIQYTAEKIYELYTSEEFPHGQSSGEVNRYINFTDKYFDFDRDFLKSQLDYTSSLTGKMPLSCYTPTGNFIVLKSVESTENGYDVKYLNGMRSFDNHTGRYQLLDCVESTLVLKLNNGKLKAVANKNAYYDSQDERRYREYLRLLHPALEYNWDGTADNPLTNSPDIMKSALQNIILNDNLLTDHSAEDKFRITEYRYAAEKIFSFGSAGFEHMLKNDDTYSSEDNTVRAASNNSENSTVKVTGVAYTDGYRVVCYEKDGTGGQLTVKRYPDGSEKISANKYDYRRLTLKEIEQVNKYYRNDISWQYVVNGLTGKPEEIDVSDIVNHLPAEGLLTYKNYYEIKQRKEAGVNFDYSRLERGLEEYGKVSAKTVEKLLLETVNISLDQMEKDVKTNYSPSYNCFYKTDNYVTCPYMQFVDGYAIGDSVVLYDKGKRILTLKKQGENYYLYSLEMNKEDNIKDIYEENGISTDTQYFVRDTYFEPQPDKSESYNYAIEDYNEFLSGNIYVNGEHCEPEKWIEGAETPISRYGLFDLNNDGIPELILYIPYNCYEVYSHDGYRMGTMTQWDVKFDGSMSGPGMIFRDGTAGVGRISTGAGYSFYKYDKNGNCNKIMRFSWYEPWNDYNFNGTHVSKEEFEKLTDPWLDKFDTEADTGEKTYFLEKEYWEIYADKLA